MKIIFVCHGNICRSVAAEYVAKAMDVNHQYNIVSRATSYEEIGNDIYPPMKQELYLQGIPFGIHHATRIIKEDYDSADYIFYMDDENKYYLDRIVMDTKNKVKPIYLFTPEISEIEDPWYTRNFHKVVEQIKRCVSDIFNNIEKLK